MLACLQGTFRIKPKLPTSLQSLLSQLCLRLSLAPADSSRQPPRLQVCLTKSALENCASGKLLHRPILFWHWTLELACQCTATKPQYLSSGLSDSLYPGMLLCMQDQQDRITASLCSVSGRLSVWAASACWPPKSELEDEWALSLAEPEDYGRKHMHSHMREVLSWLLPQHSARAMPDSGSVLPTSPRHQAARAFVSLPSRCC